MVGSGVTGAEFASPTSALGSDVVAGVVARPGAARRGRGRGRGARGRVPAARHEGDVTARARPRCAATGERGRRRRSRTVAGSRARTADGGRLDRRTPTGIGLVEAGVAARPSAATSTSTGSRGRRARGVYAAGDFTGVLMLASVAAMQGRIAMWHALGDAVTPLDLQDGVRPTCSPTRRSPPSAFTAGGRGGRRIDARIVKLPLRDERARQDAGHPRRLRQALLPARDRHRRRRCRRRAAGDPSSIFPRRDRGGAAADRRPAGAHLHGLPVADRLDRRGRPPAAPRTDRPPPDHASMSLVPGRAPGRRPGPRRGQGGPGGPGLMRSERCRRPRTRSPGSA